MVAALLLTWGISLGYPYQPPQRIWLESGGIPRYGLKMVTSHRPLFWMKVSW